VSLLAKPVVGNGDRRHKGIVSDLDDPEGAEE
jgi:hypothetical protein